MTGAVPSPLPGSAHPASALPASALPASALPASALRAEGVWKAFGERPVLRGVSVSLAAHEVVALIGASGSGKSTLLRCLGLLEPIDDGRIFLGDEDISDPRIDGNRVRARLGAVFQSYNLFPHLTVLGNVTLASRVVHKVPRKDAEARAMALLERVGLADFAGHYPAQLSGGQQQRVAIARALAMDPKLMLFDEPTSALDPELVGDVLDVMRELANEGMTMIVVTHEIGFARGVADQVVFMDGGVVVEAGPPSEVLDNPQRQRTRNFLDSVK